jgi:hypothetical protein
MKKKGLPFPSVEELRQRPKDRREVFSPMRSIFDAEATATQNAYQRGRMYVRAFEKQIDAWRKDDRELSARPYRKPSMPTAA